MDEPIMVQSDWRCVLCAACMARTPVLVAQINHVTAIDIF